jgi:hypothetical protein
VGANVLLRRLGEDDAANGMMRVNHVFTEEMYYDRLDAALDSGRFEAPYSFLSVAARQQQTLDQFAGRFVNTRRIALRTAEGARVQGDRGFLIAHTYTETATAQGLVRSCSQVEWDLVRELRGWRRDIVSGSGNEQGERC